MTDEPASTFSRLFEGHRPGYPEAALAELAEGMKDGDDTRLRTPNSPPSGYVYFAQFVDHDLVKDKTQIGDAGKKEPEETSNYRSPRLDLEILYRNPEGNYYQTADDLLAIGPTQTVPATIGKPEVSSTPNDLPRRPDGSADIWEERNDFTLLVAQLHVMFLKFHNRIVQYLQAGKIGTAGPPDASLFEQARRLVTWHYQWWVRHDFLPRLVQPDVLTDILMHWPRLYRPPKSAEASRVRLPVEFTLAAYQFGHTAVQKKYSLNRYLGSQSLLETLTLTGPGHFGNGTCTCLPADAVVEPGRMFGWAPSGWQNFAEDIDTLIAPTLFELPPPSAVILTSVASEARRMVGGAAKFDPLNRNLPLATLVRGSRVGIPSGQELCKLANVDSLGPDQIGRDHQTTCFLRSHGMLDQTPLFYYLMREAELAGRCNPGGLAGKCLGPLGSRIVAEVLLGVLMADPGSFVYANWRPPYVDFGVTGYDPMPIDTLKRFSIFADGYAETE